jgi:[ribosomal protein S18]-alanine N-acetyltransferase
VELVYLGPTVQARGRGLGDHLMLLALATTARREFKDLSLAVDSANAPAMRLYRRHGFKRVGRRLALVRDLCPPPAAES